VESFREHMIKNEAEYYTVTAKNGYITFLKEDTDQCLVVQGYREEMSVHTLMTT
jgi:hypothetical protein